MARALTPDEEARITAAVRVIEESTALLRSGGRSVVQAVYAAEASPRGKVAARQQVDDHLARQQTAFGRIERAAAQITATLAESNR